MKAYNLFSFLENVAGQDRDLVIPRIQRSYAQGREKETTVRGLFLRALFEVLRGERDGMILNYAFGALFRNRFELMDGQQRLTTLFLLYWYLYAGEALPTCFHHFAYETRPTTAFFVQKLAQEPLELQDGKPADPVESIRRSKWFTYAFEQDPSVCAMLTMLKDIHAKMLPEDDILSMRKNLENVRFYVPDPEPMEDPDDMYSKINDRGLSLTPFECFKADLVVHLEQAEYGKLKNHFLARLDFEWLQHFEPRDTARINPPDLGGEDVLKVLENRCLALDAETGRRFFRFFFRFCAHRFTVSDNRAGITEKLGKRKMEDVWNFFYKESEQQTQSDGKINEQLEKYQGFDCYRALLTPTLVEELGRVLDTLCSVRKEQPDLFKRPWDENTITDFFSKSYTLADAILFSAFCDFILRAGTPDEGGGRWWVDLENWLGVVRSIIENSDIDKDDGAIARMREINELAGNLNGDVYGSLADFVPQAPANPALTEEIRKARLIVSDHDFWSGWFKRILQHPYLRGMAGFLLDFAEVQNAMDTGSRARFEAYAQIAMEVFKATRDGLRQNSGQEWAWERAVLSAGNYLPLRSYDRYNLLTTSGRGEYSWSQFLRKDDTGRKQFVKDVLEEIASSGWQQRGLHAVMTDICDQHGQSGVIWRDLMVKKTDLISKCGSGYIYFGPKILLLSKERTSSHHVELFTYHLLPVCKAALPGVEYDHPHDGLSVDLGNGRHLLVEAYTKDGKDLDHFRLSVISQGVEQSQELERIPRQDGDMSLENMAAKLEERMQDIYKEMRAYATTSPSRMSTQ